MKLLISFTLLLFTTAYGFSQTIANDQMNILYAGIDNPISTGAFGYSCQSVLLRADTGELIRYEGEDHCGIYRYRAPDAKYTGKVTFSMYIKSGRGLKLIGKRIFRIKEIPLPLAYVGYKNDGYISLPVLRAQDGMIAKLSGLDICGHFKVESFGYAIIRNEKIVYSGKNRGNIFQDSARLHLSVMEEGDTILFHSIFCQGVDGKSRKLASFELTVASR